MGNLPKIFTRDKSHNRLLPQRKYGYWGIEVTEDGLTFLGHQDERRHVAFSDLSGLPKKAEKISVTDKYVSFGGNDSFQVSTRGPRNLRDRQLSDLVSKATKDGEVYSITTQLNPNLNWVFAGISGEPKLVGDTVLFPTKGGYEVKFCGLKDDELDELISSGQGGRYEVPKASDDRNWKFENIPERPKRIKHIIEFLIVSFQLKSGREIMLTGLSVGEIKQLLSYAKSAMRTYYTTFIKDSLPDFQSLSDEITAHLENPKQYPAAYLLGPLLERAVNLLANLPGDLPGETLAKGNKLLIDKVRGFANSPHKLRDAAIESFIERELKGNEPLFDTIESNPLTLEQRRAVIANEDATLVLAGAGSGKTSVIVAKVAYLIESGVTPDEILVLAFNTKAAAEMSTRLKSKGFNVTAQTFHSFGNMVIGSPTRAEWVGKNKVHEVRFRNHLRDKVKDVTEQNSELGLLLKKYFYDFYLPYKSEFDFKNQQEYEEYVHSHGELLTLTGDTVKSVEELRIANWLSMNGIDYKYERKYPHKLPSDWKSRRGYKPDFYLTESEIYIEHFGLGRDNQTAPWVDSVEYLAEIEGKRKAHQDNETTLIETFSYEHREQIWRDTLAKHLDSHGVKLSPVSQGEILDMLKKLEENSKVDAFTETLKRFLVQFKELDITFEECVPVDGERSKAFLDLFEPVYQSYQNGIEDAKVIDFTDMIVRASRHVEERTYTSPFKYILVDEFQDISDSRARLLKALKAQHHDARLFAVGDDWQSINRFSGTNIGLMHDFGQEFGGNFAGASDIHRTAPLGHTFRFSVGIAEPAAEFILKNESQIPKKISTEHVKHTSDITIAYTCRSCATEKISQGLAALARVQPTKDTKKLSILFLGRENSLKPANFDAIERRYRSKLSIKFMSVHASKGLEADRVIVLDVKSGKRGFPSERLDDPVLNMVLPEQEELKQAEERRLFYVALTRAKEKVTIFANKRKPSVFVTELLKDSECKVRSLCDHRTCPKCDEGWLRPVSKRDGTVFLGCSRYYSDDCTFTESIAKKVGSSDKTQPDR